MRQFSQWWSNFSISDRTFTNCLDKRLKNPSTVIHSKAHNVYDTVFHADELAKQPGLGSSNWTKGTHKAVLAVPPTTAEENQHEDASAVAGAVDRTEWHYCRNDTKMTCMASQPLVLKVPQLAAARGTLQQVVGPWQAGQSRCTTGSGWCRSATAEG